MLEREMPAIVRFGTYITPSVTLTIELNYVTPTFCHHFYILNASLNLCKTIKLYVLRSSDLSGDPYK
jgi:hypothetical protein